MTWTFVFYPTGRPAWPRWMRVSIDHLTRNVHRGNMNLWSNFYERIGNFPRNPLLRHRGQADGAALPRHDGSLRQNSASPSNESADDKSQIEEYLRQYGEGIQHIALASGDIYQTIPAPEGGAPVHADPRIPIIRGGKAGSRGIRRIWRR